MKIRRNRVRGRLRGCMVALLSFFAIPTTSRAAIHCVRAGAAGNGSGTDWTNAYTDLPTNLVRGDTYYVAAGTYASHTFSDPISGALVITIKKATLGDHGTSVSWLDSYASGQAVFLGFWFFTRDNYLIDGVTRTGLQSGHGIKVDNSATTGNQGIGIALGNPNLATASNVTLRYVEVQGSGNRNDTIHDRGVQIFGGSDNITISFCHIHDVGEVPILIRRSSNTTIEYSWIARNQSSPTFHSEAISVSSQINNFTVRYDYFEDIEGTAFIATAGDCAACTPSSNWYIYGNIFFFSIANPAGQTGVGDGVISFFDTTINGDVFIHNNSIINLPAAGACGINIQALATRPANLGNVAIRNNLWYNCVQGAAVSPTCSTCSTYVASHNAYFNTPSSGDTDPNKQAGTASPFVNYTGQDFHLAAGTLAGFALAAVTGQTLNLDMDGSTRGADGAWDRGAFEFLGLRPTPPTNMRLTVVR